MPRLLSLFVALAVMIMPLGMIGGAAAAHTGRAHTMVAASDCHQTSPAPEKKSKPVGMSAECALACAALPAMPARIERPMASGTLPHPIVALHGLIDAGPESLDPPPRG